MAAASKTWKQKQWKPRGEEGHQIAEAADLSGVNTIPSTLSSSAILTPPLSSSSNALQFDSSDVLADSVRATKGSLVPYLPQDDAVAAGLPAEEGGIDAVETQQVADLLNEELGRLLKMRPHQFWQTVTTCDSVEASLDSYLQFRRRWYDVCNNERGKPLAGVIVGEQELSRRVFMLLYRMSLSSESGSLPAENMYRRRIFNIPRLLDICAIYGHDNVDLTQHLVSNAFTINERLVDDLANTVPIISNTVQTMQQRCSSIMLMLTPTRDAVGKIQRELLEVLGYLIDTVVSLHAFVDAYPDGALVLVLGKSPSGTSNQILSTLATMHDVLIPTVSRSFSYWMGSPSGESTMQTHSKRLRFRLLELVWRLLCFSYLKEDNVADSKDSTIRHLEEVYICDGQARGETIVQSLSRMVEETYQYLSDEDFINSGQLIRNIDRKHGLLERVHQLRKKGLITLDSAQYDYIKALIDHAPALPPSSPVAIQSIVSSTTAGLSEADVLNESKISHIKDILPDYGSGFIGACLEAYDNNPEEVIQRILEGTLHPALQCLDPSLETKPGSQNVSVPVKDKGKGKVVEATSARTVSSKAEHRQASRSVGWHVGPPPQKLSSSTSASSSLLENGDGVSPTNANAESAKDVRGRYVRKDKGEENVSTLLNEHDRDDVLRTAAYAAQYEDEYDDSFDDLGTNIADGVEETEILVDYARLKAPLENDGGSQKANKMSSGGRFDGWEKGGWGSSSNGGSTLSNAKGTPSRESGSKVLEAQRLGQSQPSRGRGKGRRNEPRGQFFVKDGKNYSYRVAGSVTTTSLEQAEALKRVEAETIYGLREGGNVSVSNVQVADGKDVMGANSYGNPRWMHGDQFGRERGAHGPGRDDHPVRGGGTHGSGRGAPRKEHDHHHRKDRAMKKHFSSLGGM